MKNTFKNEVISVIKTEIEQALSENKDYIIRAELPYILYQNGFQTKAGLIIKNYVLANGYDWIAVHQYKQKTNLHGNKGIIVLNKK